MAGAKLDTRVFLPWLQPLRFHRNIIRGCFNLIDRNRLKFLPVPRRCFRGRFNDIDSGGLQSRWPNSVVSARHTEQWHRHIS